MNNTKIKEKWFLQTWFISLVFAFSWLILPFFAGCVLVFLQYKQNKSVWEKFNAIQDLNAYEMDIKSQCEKQILDVEKVCREKQETTWKECAEKKSETDTYAADIKAQCEKQQFDVNKVCEERQQTTEKECIAKIAETEKNCNMKIAAMDLKLREEELRLKRLSAECSEKFVEVVVPYEFDLQITSEEHKNNLAMLKVEFNEFLKTDEVINNLNVPATMGSKIKKSILNADIKQILRCFNSEATYIISNLTINNVDTCRNKLQKSFENLNKIFHSDYIELNKKLLEYKLKELNIQYSYLQKKQLEKEQQQAIKEQMIEEEKVRREIEREKAKLDKEESQFKNEISKLMTYLQKASDIEKQLYVDKIKELEDKLKLLEKDRDNVLQREQSTRAGFVYIISNIGSFGENVYKIGMTRRLEPMDRVKELGDASVPFEFDVHAMIFSEDAPDLENILHKTFANKAVNKVNPRKEFYRIDLASIEKVVKENHNATVTFTELAKAEQYRETLKIEQEL